MRKLVCGLLFVVSPWLATLLFWALFGACVDPGPPSVEVPVVRLVASWDPLACGDPHRVALELEDEDGAKLSASAPCAIGGLTLDAPHFGVYRGRIFAWTLGEPAGPSRDVELTLDDSVVRWIVETV